MRFGKCNVLIIMFGNFDMLSYMCFKFGGGELDGK